MKITKQLKINQQEATLVNDAIKQDMQTPGRCVLTVYSEEKPTTGQLLEISAQMSGQELRRVFFGFIDTVTQQQNGIYKIVGREFSAMLNRRIALNLRHVKPSDVLQEISKQTGLQFILPKSEWTKKTIARFQHIGGGYGAMDSILNLWQVERGLWQQQPDGQIYIGESIKSAPGQKRIKLAPEFFETTSVQGGTLPLVPRIRAGVQIEIAEKILYVNSIEIMGDKMRLNWLRDPWEKHLQAIR